MADIFSETANVFLTAVFFQPLMPFAIPLAFAGFVINYWINKFNLLYLVKRPEEMSDLLPLFFANLIPVIALVWSLSLALFYMNAFEDFIQASADFDYTIPLWIMLGFTFMFNLIPIRSMINKSFESENYTGIGAKYYD